MVTKLFIFAITSSFFLLKNPSAASTATCRYHNDTTTSLTESYFQYSCELTIFNSGEVTRIGGNHGSGYDESDVKIITADNEQTLTKLSSIFCLKFGNLETIKLTDTKLELVDSNSLQNCKNLKILKLNRNEITGLPENLLSKNQKLTFLQLDFNELFTLPENVFQSQNQLDALDLSSNQLNYLPDYIFKSLVNLKNLWLVSNKLSVLNPLWFKSLQKLEVLYIDSNEISELPWNIFSQLKNLESLGLSSNNLLKIHSDWFDQNKNLKAIQISNNKITEIDEKLIDKTALDKLDMTENICSSDYVIDKNKIKEKMEKCFENYQPRERPKDIRGIVSSLPQNCGKIEVGKANIIGGTHSKRGEFPWNVALVTPKGKFFCGGSLVTSKLVVTAAHCINEKSSAIELLPREIVVLLGAYDLNNSIEIGRLSIGVREIYMHKSWNPNIDSYDADIAILELAQDVQFSNFIQPICLIEDDSKISNIHTGIVAGYGKSEDETKMHENIPKIIEVPIIQDNQDCFYKNIGLVKISSNRTFCGGRGDGSGVCSGDSGGGVAVLFDDTYYLRGIVSASLYSGETCNVNSYAVFTNVLAFNGWINEINEKIGAS